MIKIDAGDGSFPLSTLGWLHYLKVFIVNFLKYVWTIIIQPPDQSSEELLRERLLAATNEKGFHLNY